MKFSVDTKEFLGACTKVKKASAKKSTLSALDGIYVKTETPNKISVCCNDTELAISTTTSAVVEEEGAMCIDSDTLINILKMLDGCITFTEEKTQMFSICGLNSRYAVMSYDTKDFPKIPNVTTSEGFDIGQKDFSDMIKQTIFAASEDVTKGAHTGVKFEVTKDNLKLVALDGYRFAIRTHHITYYDESIDFVVPKRTLNEVGAIAGSDGEMSIEKGEQFVVFTIGECKVVSRLLAGEFLDYTRAIPVGNDYVAKVTTGELLTNINRCAVIINDRIKAPLKLTFTKDELNLAAETTIGNVKAKMGVEFTGDEFTIGVNHKFLKDALEACKEDGTVTISCCSSTRPMLITGISKTYLILPVRL